MRPQTKSSTRKRWLKPVEKKCNTSRPWGSPYKKVASKRKKWTTTHRQQLGRHQEGQGVEQRNRSINVRGDASVRSIEAVDGEAHSTTARTKGHKDCARRRQQFGHHICGHRAHFYAQARPNVCVEVPDEDRVEEDRVCGCFIKVLYGTRQVAWAWQEEVKKTMREVNLNL